VDVEQVPAVKAEAPALEETDQVEELEAEVVQEDSAQVAEALDEEPAEAMEESEDLDVLDKQDRQASFQAVSDLQYTGPAHLAVLKP